MFFLKFGIAIVLLVALGACATTDLASDRTQQRPISPVLENPQSFNNKDRDTCYAADGLYEMGGLLGYFMCTMTYSDGGTICSDNKECLGQCRATDESAFDPSGRTTGQTGICQMDDNPFGCNADVIEGRVHPPLCMD